MKPPTYASQLKLVNKVNAAYKVGDKIKVKQDNGDILEWTMSNEATIMGGHTAVVWCDECSGSYMAARVVFN